MPNLTFPPLFRPSLLLFAAALPALATESKIRPIFENVVEEGSNFGNRFIHSGLVSDPALVSRDAGNNLVFPSDGAVVLQEFSLGQTFAPYTPFEDFAKEETDRLRTLLYPAPLANRSEVESGLTPFRYLSLLYASEAGETDVTNQFQQMDSWYGPPERAKIVDAILQIRAALANAPLDTGLRNLLLDAYTDRAIAEVQFIKSDLVTLGKKRLGFQVVSAFVIDEEIEILARVTGKLKTVIDQYGELFSERVEGVEPSDFDPSAIPGTPFGYYIFQTQQQGRNQTRSRFFEATTGEASAIPDYDESTESIIPNPNNQILASGYKDYVTLITIMGDYMEHSAELNRLRGLRQLPPSADNPSDLEFARRELAGLAATIPTDLSLLRNMFAEVEFPRDDTSGVYAALTGVETALADVTNIRAFLDGNANMLGLDPNFLILLQTQSSAPILDIDGNAIRQGGFDSFSQIVTRLRGPNRPLTVALAKYNEASLEYDTFRESVDEVTQELKDVRITFENRFLDITGYSVGIDYVLWDGINPKPGVASELEQVNLDMELLGRTNGEIDGLIEQFDESERLAIKTLTTANGLNRVVDEARQTYSADVSDWYRSLQIGRPIAAAAQAGADATYAAAGLGSFDTILTGGGPAVAITVAGAANSIAQGVIAGKEANAEKGIDEASKIYEGALQRVDNALTVSQSQDALQDLLRERYSATIEKQQVLNGLAQATAKRKALFLELDRIQQTFQTNNKAVRSSYFADPIHFIRSQNSILDADAAFAEAQRWMFYAQRALEHKWTQRFGVTSGGKDYDSGSLFKMRNVNELDDLLTAFLSYDASREQSDVTSTMTSIISLKDNLLARNPKLSNLTNTADDDLRVDLSTGTPTVVTQTQLFRNKLSGFQASDGAIHVPFNTALLQDIQGLFLGPEYSSTGGINSPGQWRDKIIYVKFNIIAEDAPVSGPGGFQPLIVNGAVGYGGLTIFRTRVVPRPALDLRLVQTSDAMKLPNGEFLDYPGEFFVQPYRFYQSEKLDNVFQVKNENLATGSFAYSGRTARASGPDTTQEDVLGQTFQINDFKELSVAATRWRLTLNANQPNLAGQALDIDKIEDIELIIRHRASSRVIPNQ